MICIIDTSALITLYQLELFNTLPLVYEAVYVPITVEREFLSADRDNRLDFLLRFYDENAWFRKCLTFDADTEAILRTDARIHDGEREVMAQYRRLSHDLQLAPDRLTCMLDDRHARNIAFNMTIDRSGTLLLLARLATRGYFDYTRVQAIKRSRRFSDAAIKQAWTQATREAEHGSV